MPLIARVINDYHSLERKNQDLKLKKETPGNKARYEHILDMNGIILQLMEFSEKTADIFEDLTNSLKHTSTRLSGVSKRTFQIMNELDFQNDSSSRNAYLPSTDPETWQNTLSGKRKLSKAIQDQYDECNKCPDLKRLNKYFKDNRDCSKMFSDPFLFVNDWITSEIDRQETSKKENEEKRKLRKELKAKAKASKEKLSDLSAQKEKLSNIQSWREMYGLGMLSPKERLSIPLNQVKENVDDSVAHSPSFPPLPPKPAIPENVSPPVIVQSIIHQVDSQPKVMNKSKSKKNDTLIAPPSPPLLSSPPTKEVPLEKTIEPSNTKPRRGSFLSQIIGGKSLRSLEAKTVQTTSIAKETKQEECKPQEKEGPMNVPKQVEISKPLESKSEATPPLNQEAPRKPPNLLAQIQAGAALKKSSSISTESIPKPTPPVNLLAQIQAGAALKKSASTESTSKVLPPTDLLSQIQAAKQKSELKKTTVESPLTNISPSIPLSGPPPERFPPPINLLSQIKTGGANLRHVEENRNDDKLPLPPAFKSSMSPNVTPPPPPKLALLEQIRSKQCNLKPVEKNTMEKRTTTKPEIKSKSNFGGTIAEILARRMVIACESDSESDEDGDWN